MLKKIWHWITFLFRIRNIQDQNTNSKYERGSTYQTFINWKCDSFPVEKTFSVLLTAQCIFAYFSDGFISEDIVGSPFEQNLFRKYGGVRKRLGNPG